MFPAFRARFIKEAAWCKDLGPQEALIDDISTETRIRMAGGGPAAARGPAGFMRPLMLDLSTLPREDGPPSESVLKRQKFAVFEKHCSQVADGLFVSGEAVARDRGVLAANSITHVVNCVGALYPEYFKNDGIQYKTLWLQDQPQEDITCVLYDTFDFIEAARKGLNMRSSTQQQQQQQHRGGKVQPLPLQHQQQQQQAAAAADAGVSGRVLVHCSQGVSRSTTIAIAYLMWKTGGSYEQVYQTVRALRGVTSPNVGFMCQLINWAKRRQRPPARVRLYRISPHCADAPLYLVPKAVSARQGCSHPDCSQLDPRGCFVAHLPNKVYVWRGRQCLPSMLEAGLQAAARLTRYEHAPAAQLVQQGEEPADFLAVLSPSGRSTSSSTCGTSGCCTRADSVVGDVSNTGTPAAAAAAASGSAVGAAGGLWPSQPDQSAAARGSCSSSSPQQQQAGGEGDTEMSTAPPSAAGSRPTSAGQQQQQPWQQSRQEQQQLLQQQQPSVALQQQTGGACTPLPASKNGHATSSAAGAAAVGAAAPEVGPNSSSGSSSRPCAWPCGDPDGTEAAAAAAAAAQVLLGVQLGPTGSLAELQQVREYDAEYELWLAAQQRASSSSQLEGRPVPGSPLTAPGGAWEEAAAAAAHAAGGHAAAAGKPSSPASLEGRNRKYSRSDSEGRSVVPTCRQPGRLSASSSQAWPDSNTPGAGCFGVVDMSSTDDS